MIKDTRIFLLGLSLLLIVLPIILITIGHTLDKEHKHQKYNIELPEEYSLISRDTNSPDTLIGYIKGDTIYIEFLKDY